MRPEPLAVFPSVEAFYEDRVARRFSGEVDYGVWWTEPFRSAPTHRVSWVVDTGELVVVRLTPHALSRVTPTDRVEVLAVVETRNEVERLLEGWAEACGQGGLAWLWDRVNVYRKARS